MRASWGAGQDMLKDFPTDNFFLPGFHARYGLNNVYTHDCPSVVKDKLVSYWANEKDPKDAKACIGGAFIWNLDYAYRARIDPYACPGVEMADITNYTSAIAEAMQN
jgi:hypothetical protein